MWSHIGSLWLGAALALAVLPGGAAADVLTFGVAPQPSVAAPARLWAPVVARLARHTGLQLRVETAPDVATFERRVARGEYDFALMNPHQYTVFHDVAGYEALAHARDRRVRGLLVVHRASPVADLRGLDGDSVAFAAPDVFDASLLPRVQVRYEGVDIAPVYLASQEAVYREVADGLFAAGGGAPVSLAALDPELRARLRVLWQSEDYAPDALAVHPRVPLASAIAVGAALVTLDQDAEAAAQLRALGLTGFRAATDADWDDLRALRRASPEQLLGSR